LRRLFLWVLLFVVPTQTAMGATGLLCVKAAHHGSAMQQHLHTGDAGHATHGGSLPQHAHEADAASQTTADERASLHLLGVGKCNACGTCSFSAVALLATPSSLFQVDAGLTVFPHVDPAIATRAGDGLFRPPRPLTL